MARKVKISTIGARYHSLDLMLSPQQAVEVMTNHLIEKVKQVLPDQPDLIVLPEYCDMPANYPKEKQLAFYKARSDRVMDGLSSMARQNRCYITYPAIQEMLDGTWRNSIRLIGRDGAVAGEYRKNHLTISEIEDQVLCGKDISVVECDFGRVGFAICFDLNFDSLRLKYAQAQPDLIVFCSMYHGGMMQNYWAYSCRSYFVGAVGGAPSAIVTPVGENADSTTNYFDFITKTVNLDYAVVHLDYNWGALHAMKQKYGPKVKMTDPGFLGSVLISSETDEFTIQDIVHEFGIEQLDEYFARSLAFHLNPEHIEK